MSNKNSKPKGEQPVKFYDSDGKLAKFQGDARTKAAKNRFLQAYIKTLGVITPACEIASVKSRQSVYSWQKNDPLFAEIMEDIQERSLDFAETSMFAQIRDRSAVMTMFYLKTKGKKRGYIETTQNVNVNRDATGLDALTDAELMEIIKGEK